MEKINAFFRKVEKPLETIEIGGDGKSKSSSPPKSKQSTQLMRLCFTYNNYKNEHIEILETTFQDFWKTKKYVFQEEIGEKCQTPHLQGSIWFTKKTRWEELKLSFGNLMRWTMMRNEDASEKYCQKSKTSKPDSKPHIWGFPKPLKLITPDRWWQKDILKIFETEADDRTVHWYWSKEGGIGKSSFVKYCLATYGKKCVFIDEGKKADIMYTIMEADMDLCEVVLFDIPRDNGNKISYKSIESIKNGNIYSPKYESKSKIFNAPHVVCFANEPPDLNDRLSNNRFIITEII